LQLQFSFYFRRHSSRSKKVPEHVGIALLRSGNSPFGVVPVAHAVGRFDNCGEHKAEIQIRPDEVKECLAGFVPDSQAFVAEVAHIQILRRNHSSGGTSICGLCAIRSAGCRHTTGRRARASRLLECPATVRYCLSKTNVAVRGLPSTSVPLAVWVRVLPSLEMTFVPVTSYFPPVFFTSQLVVFASIRLTEILSNGSPVASVEYSLPSYL